MGRDCGSRSLPFLSISGSGYSESENLTSDASADGASDGVASRGEDASGDDANADDATAPASA